MKKIKSFFAAFMLFIFCVPIFSFAAIEQPKNMDEALDVSQNILETTQKEMPGFFERAWQNEVLPVWQKMFEWAKNHLWENKLGPWLENLWQNIKNVFTNEIEQRTPTVKEEFQKEKDEIKQEAPQVGQSLWQKFQDLIK